MTEQEQQEWAKYIYSLLGCDYWVNLSTSAIEYLEKHKKGAEFDYLEDLSYLDVSICDLYWNKQPNEVLASAWLEYEDKDLYDPIKTHMMEILYLKLWPDSEYQCNMYHPVRFYCEFGIVVDLKIWEQIKGEQVGGWCNVWEHNDSKQTLHDIYIKLANKVGIVHPSKKELLEDLEQNKHLIQQTLF